MASKAACSVLLVPACDRIVQLQIKQKQASMWNHWTCAKWICRPMFPQALLNGTYNMLGSMDFAHTDDVCALPCLDRSIPTTTPATVQAVDYSSSVIYHVWLLLDTVRLHLRIAVVSSELDSSDICFKPATRCIGVHSSCVLCWLYTMLGARGGVEHLRDKRYKGCACM